MRYKIAFLLQLFTVAFLSGQNVGIGTLDPKAKLDVHGDLILQSTELIIPDGTIYQLDVNTNKYNHYKLTGPTSNFQIAGITAAEHDRTVALYNRTGVSLEVYNDDVTALSQDRILTGTGGTFAVFNGGNVVLKYDTTITKWEIISSHFNSLDFFGSSWAGNANDIYSTNSGNVGVGTNAPPEKLSVVGNVDISGDIKTSGVTGQAGDYLQNNGNGTMSWMPMMQNESESVGYGTWGCGVDNVTDYNPVLTPGSESSCFGQSADINGSYAIIGAPCSIVNGNASRGCAYVYMNDGTNWIMQKKLIASDGLANDAFGWRVAIRNNWAVVSAYHATIAGNLNRGAVYIFNFNGSDWIQTQKIINPNGGVNDLYGFSISMDETHVAIANIAYNNDTGAVELYTYNGSQWVLETQINPTGGSVSDEFGTSTSVEGNTILIGSAFDDNGHTDEGSVYFFQYNGSAWVQTQKFYYPVSTASDNFGISVSLSGNNAIVGSNLDRLQFFKFDNGVWTQGRNYSIFGTSVVTISGNYAMSSNGRIYKLSPQAWIPFETVGDPESIAAGASFPLSKIDQGRFVIGSSSALGSAGIAIFGKIKE